MDKLKILNLDYFDMCCSTSYGYGKDRIRKLLETAKNRGINRVHFRTSVCGKVCYPSRVMTTFDSEYRLFALALAESMKKLDPLETTIKICKELNIEIYAWVTLFDSYFPGLEDGFFAKNPGCLMESRDGKQVLRGIPCYAEEKTQQYRLAEVKELVDYGIDGIFYSLHSHTICTRAEGDLAGEDVFGYNKPIVNEYRKRYGIDIRKQPFDKMKWYKLHGEYFTAFLKKVKKVLRNKKLVVGSFWEKENFRYSRYGYSKGLKPVPYWEQIKIHLDLNRWVSDDIVNGIFCHTEDIAWFEKYRSILGNSIELLVWLHCGFTPEETKSRLNLLAKIVKKIEESSLNGMIFHEAMSFEFACPKLWNLISHI